MNTEITLCKSTHIYKVQCNKNWLAAQNTIKGSCYYHVDIYSHTLTNIQ